MSRPTLSEWAAHLRKQAAPAALRKEIGRELGGVAVMARAGAVMYATKRLKVRTGKLRQSISSGVRVSRDVPEAFVRAATPYAGIQELGGVVRPKRSRYLTIPLDPVLTAAGVTRQSARQTPGLFPYRARSGKLFLARDTGDGIEMVFQLVRQVKIRPKYYLRDAMKDAAKALPPKLRRMLVQVVEVPGG